jgi:GNAT superfamily N-acetyltransferase
MPVPNSDLDIVPMAEAQEEAVAEIQVAAFLDDPMFVFILPDAEERRLFLRRFMTALARRSRLYAVALVTAPEFAGASLWKGPDLRELTAGQLAACGLDRLHEWIEPAPLARYETVTAAFQRSFDEGAPEPCWYLGVVGVAPAFQGRGLGTALMQPILDRADREGVPATLETAQPRNLPLYRRLGFEVLDEIDAGETGGLTLWTMKRPTAAD